MNDSHRQAIPERGGVAAGAVRVGPLMSFCDVVAELGADPDALLAEAGISRDYLQDPENPITFSVGGRLLGRAVEATGCQHLGLLLGRRATMSALGAVGFLMRASPTVGDALRALVAHLGVHDRGAMVTLDVEDRFAALSYFVLLPDIEAVEQVYSLSIAIGNGLLREMCGDEWRAEEVQFSFAARDANVYRQAFEAPVRFDAERSSLVFPAAWLSRNLTTADPLLHRLMTDRIRVLEARAPATVVERARQLLTAMVLLPNCTAAILANRLGTTERTLFRRLADEGTTFQSLRDEACMKTAYELLGQTDRRAGEVAAILGYSDASAFTRAFERWSGTTPAAWKAARKARAG